MKLMREYGSAFMSRYCLRATLFGILRKRRSDFYRRDPLTFFQCHWLSDSESQRCRLLWRSRPVDGTLRSDLRRVNFVFSSACQRGSVASAADITLLTDTDHFVFVMGQGCPRAELHIDLSSILYPTPATSQKLFAVALSPKNASS